MRMFCSHRSGFKKQKKPTLSHFLFLLLGQSQNGDFQFSVDSQPPERTKVVKCNSKEVEVGFLPEF